MRDFAELCEAIRSTTKKLEKVQLVAKFLSSHSTEDTGQAALYLSGYVFPAHVERTLNVGGATLWRVIQEVAGSEAPLLEAAYRRHGDLGSAAYEVLTAVSRRHEGPDLFEVQQKLTKVAEIRGAAARAAELRILLQRTSALQVKYIVKIILGDLRIGLRESLVEEAIAKAYGAEFPEVRRANMLLGDIGETLRLAAQQGLTEARMRLYHPLGFMLATPAETSAEALDEFEEAQVEDKLDGIRAQVHCGESKVRIFSRTLDEISGSFPELVALFSPFPDLVILDGEILAWQRGRALPFKALQTRLGRKRVSHEIMRAAPSPIWPSMSCMQAESLSSTSLWINAWPSWIASLPQRGPQSRLTKPKAYFRHRAICSAQTFRKTLYPNRPIATAARASKNHCGARLSL